jgi:hypothetical protein
MYKNDRSRDSLFAGVLYISCVCTGIGIAAGDDGTDEYRQTVTVRAMSPKAVYARGEFVPIVIAVANHGDRPVYILTDAFDPYVIITDANGTRMVSSPISDPNVLPPRYYYTNADGKRVFAVPVTEITGRGLIQFVLPNALKRHGSLRKGTYDLMLGEFETMHNIDEVIKRTDVEHRTWIDPAANITRVRHQLEPVTVEIRDDGKEQKYPEKEGEVTAQSGFAWPTFLVGAVVGLILPCAVFLMRKKA